MTDRWPTIASTGGPTPALPDWLSKFLVGGPTPIEPDLLSTQLGEEAQPGQTRRPNVLPFTVDAQTGQLTWAVPRVLDLLGQTQLGSVMGGGRVAQAVEKAPPVQSLSRPELLPDAVKSSGRVPEMAEYFGDPTPRHVVKSVLEDMLSPWLPQEQAMVQKWWPEMLEAKAAKTPPQTVSADNALAKLKAFGKEADSYAQKPWTEADQLVGPAQPEMLYTTMFGTHPADKMEKIYKDWLKMGGVLDAEEQALVSKHWPEMLEGYKGGVAPPTVPAPVASSSWEVPFEPKKARRMVYPDEVVGPEPPVRDLAGDPLQRAEQLGFLPKDLYSGVPNWGTDPPIAFKDPRTSGKGFEQAIFLTDKPSVAEQYGQTYGTIMPLRARMQNPLDVNWAEVSHSDSYNSYTMQTLINEALEKGHDSLVLRGMYDLGGKQDQYLVLNPNQLRSKFARFDPQNIDANNLLASLTLMLGGAAAIPEGKK